MFHHKRALAYRRQREAIDATNGSHALGWASLGIALAEFVAPQKVQAMLGIKDRPSHRGILRVLAVRELLQGVGILAASRPNRKLAAGVWSRVAGDALDTALLGLAATKTRRPRSFAAVAASVAAIGLADLYYYYAVKVSRHRRGK